MKLPSEYARWILRCAIEFVITVAIFWFFIAFIVALLAH